VTSLHCTSLHFTPHCSLPCTFGRFATTLQKPFTFSYFCVKLYDLLGKVVCESADSWFHSWTVLFRGESRMWICRQWFHSWTVLFRGESRLWICRQLVPQLDCLSYLQCSICQYLFFVTWPLLYDRYQPVSDSMVLSPMPFSGVCLEEEVNGGYVNMYFIL
jgi:hypothetical protein